MGQKINREVDYIRYFQTFDEHYEYFATWMENRIIWLNNYYHSPEFIKQDVKLSLSGKGTQADPYLIASAEDFYNFSMVMAGGESFEGKYFRQTVNIDMTTVSYYSGVANPNIFEDLRILVATVKILFMPESTDGIAEGTHAGEQYLVGAAQNSFVGSDDAVCTDHLQGAVQGKQGSHTVVNNGDHYNTPFVEGISSAKAASMATAARRLRPADLKAPSMI